jgi:hypothetical protein
MRARHAINHAAGPARTAAQYLLDLPTNLMLRFRLVRREVAFDAARHECHHLHMTKRTQQADSREGSGTYA